MGYKEDSRKRTSEEDKEEDAAPLALVPSEPPIDPANDVFDYWAERLFAKTSKRKPVRNQKRMKPIRGRLAEEYSAADLKRAIDAVERDPFYFGKNDRGATYIEPKTIFRDAGKVDELLAAKLPTTRIERAQQPKQPNAGSWQPEIER